MVRSFISDRIVFKRRGEQTAFITSLQGSLKSSTEELSIIAGVSRRTIADWKKGKFNMPYSTALSLAKKANLEIPKNTSHQSLNEHLKSIARHGGTRNFEKHNSVGGNVKQRKDKWKEWWNKNGKFRKIPILERQKIEKPKRDTGLAEFVGVMIGDGGVAPYHISVTLDSETDQAYGKFVKKLIDKLFKVKSKIYYKKDSRAFDVVVQRKNLVDFCQHIGLPLGNKLKTGLDIPGWIKRNKKLSIACIRGLFDTDGSMFKHRYMINGKQYSYLKVSLSSRSPRLLSSVMLILRNLGISVRISRDKDELRIDGQDSVGRYLAKIGTHNPKHQEKTKKWRGGRVRSKAPHC